MRAICVASKAPRKAAVTARVFNPGSDMLVQYLLVDGERTMVVDGIASSGQVPRLNPPLESDIVQGKWDEE